MAKEVVAGETVGTIDDDGPEEGEIEDDTSEEDGAEKKVSSSKSSDVNASVGINYYQPPGSSKSESHIVKTKLYSGGKKRVWRNPKRRNYNFYVDHDKPSRDSYNRLTKSDLNSDHREVNFHDLLKDYRTSKHGNEGNSHEKENRHFTKEGRSDTTRKREGAVSELQEEELKRSRKRKQHRSPSRDRNTSMSSDTDGVRKRKEVRNPRQRRNRKIPPRIRNLESRSTALFAQIRASKLNASSASGQQKTLDVVVHDDIEIAAEVKELHSKARGPNSQSIEEQCEEASECIIEVPLPDKGPSKNESCKSLCSASDSQTADRNEDSESKDEEDDVNQLRMIALQSAFRAKYLERKRRGIIVRTQGRRASQQISSKESNVDSAFNLDDTADLLEAAVEEAVSSSASKETPPSAKIENWQPASLSSLSEVPLPPDDPPVPSPVEDLTPVDMELALTDEEENVNLCQNVEKDRESESVELHHSRTRTNRCLSKARSIPVTIGGRTQASKSRKRTTHINDKTRSNLLEVRTCTSGGQEAEDHDSAVESMAGVNMNTMILLDAVGTCSSPEVGLIMDDEHTLSETSDAKSDLVTFGSNQGCFAVNVADDEDEELLRARLLVEISRRHRGVDLASSAITMKEMEGNDGDIVHPPVQEANVANAAQEREHVIRPNGKSLASISANLQSGRVKLPLKRSVERTRRGQLVARVRNRQVSVPSIAHASLSPYAKSYLSKITSRGKYQRVNQSRMTGGKKRIDGNLHVTVMGAGSEAKSVSSMPQQQDRIVICLGEDSDESDDDRPNAISKRFPQGNNLPLSSETSVANHVGTSESLATRDVIGSSQQSLSDSQFPIANVSADFEKSVDRFLKEVRSVQESRLQDCPPSLEIQSKSENVLQKRANVPLAKVNIKANVTSPGSRVISKINVASTVPKVTLKANSAPAMSKVVGSTAKAKPGKQITKAASGVTPQAVRHLPPPQQEEYRRLKMQISVLEELHKRRKAAKLSHVSLIGEKATQGKVCGSALSSDAPKLVSEVHPPKESNPSGKSPDKAVAGVTLELRKPNRPRATATNDNVSHSGDDIEEEDVNVMREQLLRSRLQKKMNAMTETLAEKSKASLASKEATPFGSDVVLNSMSVTPKLCRVDNNSACEDLVIKLSSVNATDNFQRKVSALNKGLVTSSDEIMEIALRAHENGLATSLLDGNPSKEVTGTSAKGDEVEGGMPKGYAVPSISKISLVAPVCSPAMEKASSRNSGGLSSGTKGEGEATVLASSQQIGGEKCVKVGGPSDQTEGNSEVKTAATQASLDLPRSTSIGVASTQFPLENNDSRASELAELEFQLLSERHAALQYLSELSSLLTKMEIEGAHLRQKEIAAQKLRAELACAESAIVVQKDYLKQLALTISSTHERVTSTRQRCSMLCHACTRLGNQLKHDKRVNGGKSCAYQVPTGGAALVKSQLSSVLWQTKQLKKAGLPFLRGQNFVTSGKCPPAKKPPRGGEVGVVQRSNNISTLSLESLSISSSSKSSPPPEEPKPGSSETSNTCESSVLLTKSSSLPSATSKLKTPVNSGACVPDASREISPAPRSVLCPEKFALALTSCAVASSVASKKNAKEPSIVRTGPEIKVPIVVATTSSQEAESSVGKAADCSNPDASEVVSLGPGAQEPKKGVQLRDYQSPLEPITNRINAENLTLSSRSSQPEESMPLDPNVILCPYDLMGECQDEECAYQHQRGKAMVKGS